MVTLSNDQQQRHHARPPWHAVLVLMILVTLSVTFLPSSEDLDDGVAVPDTFTRRLFPQYMSLGWLVAVRAVSALIIFALSGYALFLATFGGQPTKLVIPYLPESKLQRGEPITLRGLYSQAAFTMWSWNLLGLSFAVNAYIAFSVMMDQPVSPWMLRIGIMLFEMAAPLTPLVSAVVTYALWPQLLKSGKGKDPTSTLKVFHVLAFHNLNIALAMLEITLWGGLPVRPQDMSLAVLFGCSYVVFAWAIRHWWNPAAGPQFLYFFLDTTLGFTTTLALVVLCSILMVFYGLFSILHEILNHMGGGLLSHLLAVVVVCTLVCRVRD